MLISGIGLLVLLIGITVTVLFTQELLKITKEGGPKVGLDIFMLLVGLTLIVIGFLLVLVPFGILHMQPYWMYTRWHMWPMMNW